MEKIAVKKMSRMEVEKNGLLITRVMKNRYNLRNSQCKICGIKIK